MPLAMPTFTSMLIIAGIVAAMLVGRDIGNKVDCNPKKCKGDVKPWLTNPFHIVAYVVLGVGVLCALFNAGGRLGGMMGGVGLGSGLGGY
jgi:hypothetical protein